MLGSRTRCDKPRRGMRVGGEEAHGLIDSPGVSDKIRRIQPEELTQPREQTGGVRDPEACEGAAPGQRPQLCQLTRLLEGHGD